MQATRWIRTLLVIAFLAVLASPVAGPGITDAVGLGSGNGTGATRATPADTITFTVTTLAAPQGPIVGATITVFTDDACQDSPVELQETAEDGTASLAAIVGFTWFTVTATGYEPYPCSALTATEIPVGMAAPPANTPTVGRTATSTPAPSLLITLRNSSGTAIDGATVYQFSDSACQSIVTYGQTSGGVMAFYSPGLFIKVDGRSQGYPLLECTAVTNPQVVTLYTSAELDATGTATNAPPVPTVTPTEPATATATATLPEGFLVVTVRDSAANPVSGAVVWQYTDSWCNTLVEGVQTNANGVAAFSQPGSYIRVVKPGYPDFTCALATNPQAVTLYTSAEASQTAAAASLTPPAPTTTPSPADTSTTTVTPTVAYRDCSALLATAETDLTFCDLRFANIGTTYSLANRNLSYTLFGSAMLSETDLSGANLTGANLTGANLFKANLANATTTNATITNALFDGATLTGVTSGGMIGSPGPMPSGWTVIEGSFVQLTATPTRTRTATATATVTGTPTPASFSQVITDGVAPLAGAAVTLFIDNTCETYVDETRYSAEVTGAVTFAAVGEGPFWVAVSASGYTTIPCQAATDGGTIVMTLAPANLTLHVTDGTDDLYNIWINLYADNACATTAIYSDNFNSPATLYEVGDGPFWAIAGGLGFETSACTAVSEGDTIALTPLPVIFSITLQDSAGNPLVGATVLLTDNQYCSAILGTYTSGAGGVVNFFSTGSGVVVNAYPLPIRGCTPVTVGQVVTVYSSAELTATALAPTSTITNTPPPATATSSATATLPPPTETGTATPAAELALTVRNSANFLVSGATVYQFVDETCQGLVEFGQTGDNGEIAFYQPGLFVKIDATNQGYAFLGCTPVTNPADITLLSQSEIDATETAGPGATQTASFIAPTQTAAAQLTTDALGTQTAGPGATETASFVAPTQTWEAQLTMDTAATETASLIAPTQTYEARETAIAGATGTASFIAPTRTHEAQQTIDVEATETASFIAPTRTFETVATQTADAEGTETQAAIDATATAGTVVITVLDADGNVFGSAYVDVWPYSGCSAGQMVRYQTDGSTGSAGIFIGDSEAWISVWATGYTGSGCIAVSGTQVTVNLLSDLEATATGEAQATATTTWAAATRTYEAFLTQTANAHATETQVVVDATATAQAVVVSVRDSSGNPIGGAHVYFFLYDDCNYVYTYFADPVTGDVALPGAINRYVSASKPGYLQPRCVQMTANALTITLYSPTEATATADTHASMTATFIAPTQTMQAAQTQTAYAHATETKTSADATATAGTVMVYVYDSAGNTFGSANVYLFPNNDCRYVLGVYATDASTGAVGVYPSGPTYYVHAWAPNYVQSACVPMTSGPMTFNLLSNVEAQATANAAATATASFLAPTQTAGTSATQTRVVQATQTAVAAATATASFLAPTQTAQTAATQTAIAAATQTANAIRTANAAGTATASFIAPTLTAQAMASLTANAAATQTSLAASQLTASARSTQTAQAVASLTANAAATQTTAPLLTQTAAAGATQTVQVAASQTADTAATQTARATGSQTAAAIATETAQAAASLTADAAASGTAQAVASQAAAADMTATGLVIASLTADAAATQTAQAVATQTADAGATMTAAAVASLTADAGASLTASAIAALTAISAATQDALDATATQDAFDATATQDALDATATAGAIATQTANAAATGTALAVASLTADAAGALTAQAAATQTSRAIATDTAQANATMTADARATLTAQAAATLTAIASACIQGQLVIGCQARVNNPNLWLRAAPTTNALPPITSMPLGSIVTVLGGPVPANGFVWWQVNFDNGTIGWAAGQYLTGLAPTPTGTTSPTATPSLTPSMTRTPGATACLAGQLVIDCRARVNTNDLWLRSSPSTSGGVISTMRIGTSVTVLGGPVSASGFTWWQVDVDGVVGWAAGQFLTGQGMTPTATATRTATIAPTLTASRTPSQTPGPGTPTATPICGTAQVRIGCGARVNSASGLRLRASASTSAAVLTVMPSNSTVLVIGGPTTADGITWWRVTYGTSTGWASGQYLVGTP